MDKATNWFLSGWYDIRIQKDGIMVAQARDVNTLFTTVRRSVMTLSSMLSLRVGKLTICSPRISWMVSMNAEFMAIGLL